MLFAKLTIDPPPLEVEFPRLTRHIRQATTLPGAKVLPDAVFYSVHAWTLSSADRDALVYEGRRLLAKEPFPCAEVSALLNHSHKGEDLLRAWLGCLIWRIANPHRDFDAYCLKSRLLRPGLYSLGRALNPISGGGAPEKERILQWMEVVSASKYEAFVREASTMLITPERFHRQTMEDALQRCFPSSQAALAWLANVMSIVSLHDRRNGQRRPSGLPNASEPKSFLTVNF